MTPRNFATSRFQLPSSTNACSGQSFPFSKVRGLHSVNIGPVGFFIQLFHATAQAFPPEVRCADVIVSFQVMQYLTLADFHQHLRECRRVLAPNGIVCAACIPDVARRMS